MPPLLIRILKNGIPTVILLAMIGYLLAEAAGMYMAANVPPRVDALDPDSPPPAIQPSEIRQELKSRLPVTLAAWGFGLIVVIEVGLSYFRKKKVSPTPSTPPVDDTTALLNKLLEQAEAAEAARQAAGSPCPTPPPTDNTKATP